MIPNKHIHIHYYAILREQRGLSQETVTTQADTVGALYSELKTRFQWSLPEPLVRYAVNQQFQDAATILKSGDQVIFIPPVAGG